MTVYHETLEEPTSTTDSTSQSTSESLATIESTTDSTDAPKEKRALKVRCLKRAENEWQESVLSVESWQFGQGLCG